MLGVLLSPLDVCEVTAIMNGLPLTNMATYWVVVATRVTGIVTTGTCAACRRSTSAHHCGSVSVPWHRARRIQPLPAQTTGRGS